MRRFSPYRADGKQNRYRSPPAPAVSELTQIIRQKIERSGPIPFARFMELALYCPELGYYERPEARIGRRGDFYTNVSVGCLFGELLAYQCAEWIRALSGERFQLVEAGAHDGQLAVDMLSWLHRRRPALLEKLQYWIIEPSPDRQGWQRARLEEFAGRVRWAKTFDHLAEPVLGVIFSNELLDAMPMRRFGWDAAGRRWFEWTVGMERDRFVWRRSDIQPESLAAPLKAAGFQLTQELLEVLPDGFTVEISLDAAQWWQRAAQSLKAGRLVTIDYGLTAEEFLSPDRCQGTLRAYHRHHTSFDPLADPGEQDLTAHVNFSQVQSAGESAGLRTEGLISQPQFLTQIARRAWARASEFGEWSRARNRQFQTLTHPEHLGHAFRVLVQARGRSLAPGETQSSEA